MSVVAVNYYSEHKETVAEACRRLHAEGVKVSEAAVEIGFSSSAALRQFLLSRGAECPWPVRQSQRNVDKGITRTHLQHYVLMRCAGEPAARAAKFLGHTTEGMRRALISRAPDLLETLQAAVDKRQRDRRALKRPVAKDRNLRYHKGEVIKRTGADGKVEKRCSYCKQWKPHDKEHFNFSLSRQAFQSQCRSCQSALLNAFHRSKQSAIKKY